MNSSVSSGSLGSSVSSYNGQQPQSADGTLVVIVCRAKHLPNRRKLDKQSPYVTLRLGTTAKKTPSHFRAGQTPDWTHEIRFQLSRDRKPNIRLDVLDETKNDPTPIGTCEIDCSVIFADENQRDGKYIHDKWYDLSLNGRRAGMIYLEMTFYPSAPVLPPKLYETMDYEQAENSDFKSLPPPPPQHPSKSRKPSVVDDIFVNADYKPKNRFFNSLSSDSDINLGSSSSSVEPDEDVDPKNIKQKYFAKLNKFTKRFQTKEPITHLWNAEAKTQSERLSNITPINTDDFDNLDELAKDIHNNRSPQSSPYNHFHIDNDELDVPPSPPAHSVHTFQVQSYSQQQPPATPAKSSPLRKPPPDGTKSPARVAAAAAAAAASPPKHTTSVPFSADTIGIDDDCDMPTKVYFMDKQVKSLSYSSLMLPPEPLDVNEIDPKYYAPTPDQHFRRTRQEQDKRTLDYRTKETGYLGNGKWEVDNKFSPSVFDRIPNDENLGFENKPYVPPKIPQGLSEMEYYVLEKEKYLKDINGRRA